MADSGDDLTNCPVCFDEYAETGDHIPRLLPCSHTLCEKCLVVLIRKNTVDCPECRVKQEAAKGVRSFPQNKYIITHLHKKGSSSSEAKETKVTLDENLKMCVEHDREKNLFCLDSKCQKAVCSICFARHHKQHRFVDIEDQKEKFQPLFNEIETLKKDLQDCKRNLLARKTEIISKNEKCAKLVKIREDEIIKELNKLFEMKIKEIDDVTRKDCKNIDDKILTIEENITMLDNLIENANILTVTENIIAGHKEDIRRIYGVLASSKPQGCFMKYTENSKGSGTFSSAMESLCGRLEPVTFNKEVTPESNLTTTELKKKPLHASDLRCTETQSITTGWETVNDLSLFDDDSVVVSGKKQGKWKMLKYSLRNLKLAPSSSVLGYNMGGMTAITLGGNHYLAVSDPDENMLEFREIGKFDDVLLRCSVSPYEPEALCNYPFDSMKSLIFVDLSTKPNEIRWLDSTLSGFSLTTGRVVSPTKGKDISCLECVHCGGKELVLITYGLPNQSRGGIYAYNAKTGHLEWSLEDRLPGKNKVLKAQGLTTDEQGHLFVCDDSNECIQMFHVADGRYLGTLIKEGEQGLGCPCRIRWCSRISSLVVIHLKSTKWHITVFKIERKSR